MNKKIHFYFPKEKIDVENQTFFDDYEHLLRNENIYDRQYQTTINSLFDFEPPENEIEKMIKYDYSSRIAFYMTRLHDDRFDPLTPSNELFSNSKPQICLDIRNEGFIIWNCENEPYLSDPNFKAKQAQYLSFSFNNDAEVIYSIVESFITGRINFALLRIIDRLQVSYNPSGNILCEIADSRFNSESTCLYNFDENSVSRKKINLCISNNSIYYFFTLTRQASIRKKAVHLNNTNNETHSANGESKSSIRSLNSIVSMPSIVANSVSSNSTNINPVTDLFHSIKKNDSTPNIMLNSNLNQSNHTQMMDDESNIVFNQVKTEPSPHNKFPNDQNKVMINLQNPNFIHDPSQNQANEYFQKPNIDQALAQINNISAQNQNFNDGTFQIPIHTISSKPVQSDNQSQHLQNQYNKKQQTQKQQLQKIQQQMQKNQLLKQQVGFQQFQAQAELPNKQSESPPKNKSKSNNSNTSNQFSPFASSDQSSIVKSNAIYEAEGKLILLLHPTFCTDPSPDVCRASSVLDFRQKMWNQPPSLFMKNFNQMKSRIGLNLNSSQSSNMNFHSNEQNYKINPPKEKIIIPETISQMFISKNMAIKFTTY